MTLTVTLDSETEARLRAKAQEVGGDAEMLASLLLTDLLRGERSDADVALAGEEWAAIEEGIRRGDADFAAGRFRSLSRQLDDENEG
jgi:hypothetical protein